MKKSILSILLVSGFLFGCGGSESSNSSSNSSSDYDTYDDNSSNYTTCGFCNIDFPVKSLDYGGGDYCSYDCCVGGGKCEGY